ncbi:MAG: nucleotidyltransferase domain-containing protein [Gemmatimonadales bacterium]
MPVRSLDSSVLKWPDRLTVDRAVREWAQAAARRQNVVRIGYAGSYARGDWGPGSDVDILVVVRVVDVPFTRRALEWDATELPVPADVLVYTEDEWLEQEREGRRLAREAVWVIQMK